MLSYLDVITESLPNYHIFQGKQFKRSFIARCEFEATMAMQPKAWKALNYN